VEGAKGAKEEGGGKEAEWEPVSGGRKGRKVHKGTSQNRGSAFFFFGIECLAVVKEEKKEREKKRRKKKEEWYF